VSIGAQLGSQEEQGRSLEGENVAVKDKPVVVVTGASAGVGRAVARAYGARGWRVALLARGDDGLAAAADEVRISGGEPFVRCVDVADSAKVFETAQDIERQLGPIQVWVNAAFSSVFAPFAEISAEDYRRTTEVSYLGAAYGTMAALRLMRGRDRGVVVQVGSALAYRGIPLQSAYCGAKHAIQGFTESVRCELLHDRSRVAITMVQLPAVNTPQFGWVRSRLSRHPQPMPPIYQPEVAARAILFAADHPRRREYWVGGSTVLTLLANKVAPGVLDRYLASNGYRAQQNKNLHTTAGLPGNLWEPVDSAGGDGHDHGAHGAFDDQASPQSAQLWISEHRRLLAVGTGLLAAGAGVLVRRVIRAKIGRAATSAARRVN
jgi:NAD(P)-dependent dehydrogenase (short-subunit alcohol dehydrogenase family)